MKSGLLLLSVLFVTMAMAQQKMPNFTFKHNSTEFADTLRNARILAGLTKILIDNPKLRIRLTGHTALNENEDLGWQCVNLMEYYLSDRGIDDSSIEIEAQGAANPIVSEEIILKLAIAIEKKAALQTNRRAEVAVVNANYYK